MTDTLFQSIVRQYHPYVKQYLPGKNIHYAAAWGNAYEESGGFKNLFERPGQSTGGIGGWQWTGMHAPNDRRAKFETFAKSRGLPVTDISVNVDYFVEETLTLEKSAWNHVLQTTELFAATETFMLKWERPAIQGGRENNYGTARLDIRYKGAQIALAIIEELEGKTQMEDTSTTVMPQQPTALPPANPMASPPVQHPDILSALNAISAHLHMINAHLPNLAGALHALPQLASNPLLGIAAGAVPGLKAVVPFIQMAANAAPAIEQALPQVLAAFKAIAFVLDQAKTAVK